MKVLAVAIALVLMSPIVMSTPRIAQESGISWPSIRCGNPCIIEYSPGGVVDLFAAQGRELAAEHIPVIVDGPCLSACTVLVDTARDVVCVTNQAILGYHQWAMMRGDTPVYGDIHYETPGLDKYIKDHGGLPSPDSGHLLMINASEAKQFYKSCT